MTDELKPELEARLLADIAKTGFPLELRVSKRFLESGYYVQNSLYYIDKDEGKGREIEIAAFKNSQAAPRQQAPAWIRLRCHVECKKSSKPWVIFTSEKTFFDDNPSKLQVSGLADTVPWTSELLGPISATHPYWNMPRRGRSFHESFRADEDRREGSAIFKAITTAVKATLSEFKQRDWGGVAIYQPIVVLEGTLCEAFLDTTESMLLARPPWIPVSFSYQSAAYPDSHLSVVVVEEANLPALLTGLDQMFLAWHTLLTQRSDLTPQKRR